MRNEKLRRVQLLFFKRDIFKRFGVWVILVLLKVLKSYFSKNKDILSLYITRMPDREDFLPAVSEVDLRVIVKKQHSVKKISQTLKVFNRFYPIVTIKYKIFTTQEFEAKYDRSAFYTLRFYQAKKTWTKLVGEDFLNQINKPRESELLFGLFTELRHWTYYYLNQLLFNSKKFHAVHYRNIVYFYSYTELMRVYLKLKYPGQNWSLLKVLEMVDKEVKDKNVLVLNEEIKRIYKSNFLAPFSKIISFTDEWFKVVKYVHEAFRKRNDLGVETVETISNDLNFKRLGSISHLMPNHTMVNIPRYELKLYDLNINQKVIVYDVEAIHGLSSKEWRELLWGIQLLKSAHDRKDTFIYFKKHDIYFLFDHVSVNDSVLGLFSKVISPEIVNERLPQASEKFGIIFKTYLHYVFKEKKHLVDLLLSRKISDQSFAIKFLKLLQIMCLERGLQYKEIPQLLSFEEITDFSLKNNFIDTDGIKWLKRAMKSYENSYAKHKILVEKLPL